MVTPPYIIHLDLFGYSYVQTISLIRHWLTSVHSNLEKEGAMLPTSVKKGAISKNVNRSANIIKSVILNIKIMSNKRT